MKARKPLESRVWYQISIDEDYELGLCFNQTARESHRFSLRRRLANSRVKVRIPGTYSIPSTKLEIPFCPNWPLFLGFSLMYERPWYEATSSV